MLWTAFNVTFRLVVPDNACAETTNLNVTLNAVQSIAVTQTDVNLNFTTSADYLSGVNATQTNHLTFASTSGFSITAKAGTDLTGGIGAVIPISTVTITATPGLTGTLPVAPPTSAQALSKDAAITIYTSGPGHTAGVDATGGTTQGNLNINYMASGGTSYLNRTGTFSSIITYTIAPN